MAEYGLTFLMMTLGIVPFAILRYYPFARKLRLGIGTISVIFLVMIVAETWGYIQILKYGSWLGIQSFKLLQTCFYIAYFLLSCALIKEKLSRHLFVWIISASFSSLPFLAADYIESLAIFPTPNMGFVAAMLFFTPLCLWSGFYFLKKIIVPLPREPEEYTRLFSLVMLSIYLIVVVTVRGIVWGIPTRIPPSVLLGIRLIGFAQTIMACTVFKKMMDDRKRMIDLMEQQHSQETLLAISKEQFAALSEKIETAKRARHDMKHHFAALQTYLAQKDYAGLAGYVEESAKVYDLERALVFCENLTLNLILSYYYEYAGREGITMEISANVPARLSLSDADLWVLLGNLLENAVEGSLRQSGEPRQIIVKILTKGNSFGVMVENSYAKSTIRQEDERFLSSKMGAGCGNGVESIRCFARQHQGIAEFKAGAKYFLASVYVTV